MDFGNKVIQKYSNQIIYNARTVIHHISSALNSNGEKSNVCTGTPNKLNLFKWTVPHGSSVSVQTVLFSSAECLTLTTLQTGDQLSERGFMLRSTIRMLPNHQLACLNDPKETERGMSNAGTAARIL